MKRFHSSLFASLLMSGLLAMSMMACTKDEAVDPIDPDGKGNLTLEFDNYVGGTNLALGTATYKNAAGEEFTVSTFNYFVSNIELTKEDGSKVKVPNSYYLIRESDPKTLNVTLTDLPQANYTNVAFMVGVDSTKSVSDVTQRTGVLDPAGYATDNMYWSWNSGYIFVKMEGTSTAAPKGVDGSQLYQFHVGGFGGRTSVTPNNLRTVSVSVGSEAARVRTNIKPTVHLIVDAAKILSGTNTISFATTNMIHGAAAGKPLVDNYVRMFTVDHVHNDPQ